MLGEPISTLSLFNPIYSKVKDYDTVHMTPYFDNKTFEGHKFVLRKIREIYSNADLMNLKKFCEQSTPVEIQRRRTDDHVSRELLFVRNVDFYSVNFNEQGQPSVDIFDKNTLSSLLNPRLTFPETIDKCISVGLERFGLEMGWRNVTKQIACNIVRSRLPAQELITLIDWHADFQVDHSLVVTLDNPQGKERGWEGGHFCYAAEAEVDSSLYPELSNDGLSATRDPLHPTWSMSVAENEGVLFSNINTLHSVSPIKAYSSDNSPVSRTILTFFEKKGEIKKSIPYVNEPQSMDALLEFLEGSLAAYSLPPEIQEQTARDLVSLRRLAKRINEHKTNEYLEDFYDAIQEEKRTMMKIAKVLTDCILPYDNSESARQTKQITEKIQEWIYNS